MKEMSATQKPQRAFLAVTMITVVAVAAILMVYAVTLSTITGGTVTVSSIQGTIYYSETNSTSAAWTTSLGSGNTLGVGQEWYARLNITSSGYSESVTIAWTLYFSNGTAVSGATQNTSVDLSGSPEAIYSSSDGDIASNKNWGTHTTSAGDYYLKAVITA